MKRILHILLFTYCLSNTIFSQNPEWINYTDKSLINTIEIEDNYLWIGTDGGLVKYDKTTGQKTFYEKSNSGLPFNRISSIAIDSSGNKWIGTGQRYPDDGRGLVKFDGLEWTVFNTTNSNIPSNNVYCITIDKNNTKWIGTEEGLVKYDGQIWEVFKHNFTQYSKRIRCIAIDETGNKLIGSSGGIFKFDDSVWTKFSQVWSHGVSSIAIDIDGSIWAGEMSGGLAKMDENGIQYIYNPGGLYHGAISLAIDEKGNKWFGTDYDGLAIYQDGNITWYDSTNSQIPSTRVSAIKIDNSGYAWFGCSYVYGWSGDYVGIGLVKYDNTEFNFIDNFSEELLSNDVRCITIDGDNNKWIGTFGGLSKFDGSEWSMYNSDNSGLPGNFIKCLAVDSSGDLWIGSYDNGGLTKFDGTDWIVYNETNLGLPVNNVTCVAIDEFGNKWFGLGGKAFVSSAEGLAKLDEDDTTLTIYNKSNSGLPFDDLDCIAIDSLENIWLGGYDYDTEIGGLVKYDGNWNFYNESNSELPSKYVSSIFVDKQNSIWIGTSEGLAKFDGIDNWTVYNEHNSDLPDSKIKGISMDESNNLWVGTYEGLAKFDGTNWTIYSESDTKLPLNNIDCVTSEKNGNIWIGSGGWNGYGGGVSLFNENGIVSVEESNDHKTLPENYVLYQNYPNPFNPTTVIQYSIPAVVALSEVEGLNQNSAETQVNLKIYDILGREVATLVNEHQRPGSYKVNFDASALSSGVYFYKLTAGHYVNTKKLMLLK